jgi:hypothetical protein
MNALHVTLGFIAAFAAVIVYLDLTSPLEEHQSRSSAPKTLL